MRIDLKKVLLAGTAIVAVSGFAGQAQAVPTEITGGGTVVATNASGLTDTTGTEAFTIDSTGGAITLGANGTPSLIMNKAGSTLTTNITTSGAQNGVIFADDIVDTAGTIVINDTNDNLTLQGNVGASTITAGSVANPTITITSDNKNAENLTNAATINAFNAASTVNLVITNSQAGAGNTQTFTGNLGGSTAATALDTITIGADDTKAVTVTFGGNVNATAINLSTGNVGNANYTVNFGTSGQSTSVTGAISGAGAGDTDALAVVGGSTVTFNSAIGVNIDTITVGATGTNTNATFDAGVASGAITLGGATGTNSLTFSTATTSTVAGTINGGNATDVNTLNFQGGGVVTVGGAIGGGGAGFIDTVNVTGTGSGLVYGAAVTATNIKLGTGTTLTSGNNTLTITGDIDGAASGEGTYHVANTAQTVVGSIGGANKLAALTIDSGAALTVDGTAANRSVEATTISDTGTLTLNPGANIITVNDPIITATGGSGAIAVTAGTGTVNFDGDIGTTGAGGKALATLAIGTGSTNIVHDFGNVYVGATTIGAGATLDLFGTSQTVNGTIDGNGGAGRGAIVVGNGTTIDDNVTFGGVIGNTTNAINSFTVSAGSTANVSNTVKATSGGTGIVNSGTLNVTTPGVVLVEDTNGNFVSTGTINVSGANSATLSGSTDISIDGALNEGFSVAGKTLTLGAGTSTAHIGTANANTTIEAGNSIVIGGSGGTTIGHTGDTVTLNVDRTATFNPNTNTILNGTAGAVTLAAGSTLKVGVASDSLALANNTTFTALASGSGTNLATALTAGQIVLEDTGLVDLQNNTSTATALNVKAVFRDPTAVLDNSADASVATALLAFPGATGTLAEGRNNLLNAPTAQAADSVAQSLSPPSDGGDMIAAIGVTDSTFDITDERMADARTGTDTGMAAGNTAQGMKVWAQGFGQHASQDDRDSVAGYTANTWGGAAGIDSSNILENGLVGVDFSYGRSNVSSKAAGDAHDDIDSYQLTLYGRHDFSREMFADGMVAYAFDRNDQTRHDVGGVSGLDANATFNANQLAARVNVGRDYNYGNTLLTPSVLADYMYYNAQSYTETGAGTADLNVNQDSFNQLDLGLAMKAAWEFKGADGSWTKPDVHVGYRYNLLNDDVQSTSSFTGGGAAFETDGLKPGRSTFDAGADIKFMTTSNWEFTGSYDFEAKSGFTSNSGILRAGYKF